MPRRRAAPEFRRPPTDLFSSVAPKPARCSSSSADGEAASESVRPCPADGLDVAVVAFSSSTAGPGPIPAPGLFAFSEEELRPLQEISFFAPRRRRRCPRRSSSRRRDAQPLAICTGTRPHRLAARRGGCRSAGARKILPLLLESFLPGLTNFLVFLVAAPLQSRL